MIQSGEFGRASAFIASGKSSPTAFISGAKIVYGTPLFIVGAAFDSPHGIGDIGCDSRVAIQKKVNPIKLAAGWAPPFGVMWCSCRS